MKDISPTTIESQEKMFLTQKAYPGVGERLAIYHCCMLFNCPYVTGIGATDWKEYIEKIGDKALKRYGDGVTDIRVVLADVQDKRNKWVVEWGRGNARNPYTDADYERLDEIFRNYASRLESAGGMDALQDATLHNCSIMQLQAEKAIVKGDKESIDIATKLNKMIQDNLASEQLRRKDAPSAEDIRPDGFVDLLRKQYGLTVEMSKEDVLEAIHKWFTSHHYPITMDAAEFMLLSIINTTRRNNDLPELDDLPEYARMPEELAGEFESEPSAEEKEVFAYLGIPEDRRRHSGPKKEA